MIFWGQLLAWPELTECVGRLFSIRRLDYWQTNKATVITTSTEEILPSQHLSQSDNSTIYSVKTALSGVKTPTYALQWCEKYTNQQGLLIYWQQPLVTPVKPGWRCNAMGCPSQSCRVTERVRLEPGIVTVWNISGNWELALHLSLLICPIVRRTA